MTYNTNNPVPSVDVRDLYDNAQNLDSLVNGADPAYPDRLGVSRKSYKGMELDFAAFLAASGFELPALEYVDGSPLTVDRPTQLIERDGILYSVKASESFPAALTGTWVTDQARAVVRTDSDLRSELSSNEGASLIGFRSDTVAGALDRAGYFLPDAQALRDAIIPAHVNSLSTACAITQGFGGSAFSRVSGTPSPDGYCIIQSADGAFWKSQQEPNPALFGCVPGGDITAGLQRWANYVASHDEPASWDCSGYVTAKVLAKVALNSAAYSRHISGKLRLSATPQALECLVEFDGFVNTNFGDGEYIGQQVWAQRNVDNAFRFVGCKYMSAGSFYLWGTRRFGIDLGYYTTEFKFNSVNALYCGSNQYQRLPFTFESTFRYGSGVDQRSLIQSTQPLDFALLPGDGFIVNDHYYHIREVDNGGNFRIFPWLTDVDQAAIISNPTGARIVVGGGLHHGGGETNAGYIARFSGLVNGHDIQADELYPVSVGKFGTQLSEVGIRLGVDYRNAYRGGSIADGYIEGCTIFCVELADGGESPYQILQTGQLTPVKLTEHPSIVGASPFARDPLGSRCFVKFLNPSETVAIIGDPSPIVSNGAGNTPTTTVMVGTTMGRTIRLTRDRVATEANGAFSVLIFIIAESGSAPGAVTYTSSQGDLVMSNESWPITHSTNTMVLATFKDGNWTLRTIGGLV